MNSASYTIGIMQPEWGEGKAQTLTFIVTEDCNLRCKYCYITHKSKNKVLNLDTAKKFIDYVFSEEKLCHQEAVILDFIGGEPFLETELIEEICDYFKLCAYEKKSLWYWKYRINVSTNGVNYGDKEVQRFIENNEGKLSIGITIDGTKEKHDLQRVFPDGSGSYDVIQKNLDLWLNQFEGNTKVTFSSDDLKYLKDSIIHLWNIGIPNVAANVVYENVWKKGDEEIFEQQLKALADYVIDNNLYDKYYCSLFLEHIGAPYEKEDLCNTSCGAGKMLALSPDGNIYPCMRYYDYSLNKQKGYIIGNVETGIDFEKLRAFSLAMYKYQCDDECLNCPIARGCEFCQGFSYDESDTGTNFYKTKYICKMHKARVRANNYYFAKLYHKTGIQRQNFYWKNNLMFLLQDNYVSPCSYKNINICEHEMDTNVILKGLEFAKNNFMKPIFVHSKKIRDIYLKDYSEIEVLHYIPVEAYRSDLPFYDYQLIVEYASIECMENVPKQKNIIFNIPEENIIDLSDCIKYLLKKSDRININIQNISSKFDYMEYERQLKQCLDIVIEIFDRTKELKEINIITDLFFINEHESCQAGEKEFTLAPDGKLYVCPAFYSDNMNPIGDLENGFSFKNAHLYTPQYMPLCQNCESYQCENCKYINKKFTYEINVSPSFQCKKAQIEKNIVAQMKEKVRFKTYNNRLEKSLYKDPIEIFDKRL